MIVWFGPQEIHKTQGARRLRMMSRIPLIIVMLAFAIVSTNAFGVDYSQYTTEELNNMRGTLEDASPEEREALRAEWQERLQGMTPEERQQYSGTPDDAQCQPDGGRMEGRGKGKGGGGYGQDMGQGSGRGSGRGKGWR